MEREKKEKKKNRRRKEHKSMYCREESFRALFGPGAMNFMSLVFCLFLSTRNCKVSQEEAMSAFSAPETAAAVKHLTSSISSIPGISGNSVSTVNLLGRGTILRLF